ncbi:hypothetical protein [Arthrospiribacter ruber]|uniref:DUF3575 domain-containing protein n=1 Tax=Arthrospiribacter ruber TaxID=2487934 RepID=A0A951MB98_9BACT|nr:hypothetical protein [Arthrospiribacter ruber]MBW3466210.1 hypothetical protein [Arthrospiribacter ruber]
MKIYIFTLLSFIFLTKQALAQDFASVEKSIWQIQSLFVTKYLSNESKIKRDLALRSELGFDFFYRDGFLYDGPVVAWSPFLRLEPRHYYNLNKRADKGKKTAKNSGNFVALTTTYKPNWFLITNESSLLVTPALSLIPTWGIRRSPWQHFNFEAGIGIGYGWEYYGHYSYGEVLVNLHLRFGFHL